MSTAPSDQDGLPAAGNPDELLRARCRAALARLDAMRAEIRRVEARLTRLDLQRRILERRVRSQLEWCERVAAHRGWVEEPDSIAYFRR